MKLDANSTIGDVASEDILDSRDLEAIIDELENIEEEERDDDQKELLAGLVALREDCASMGWQHGIGFIRETYFKEYARDLAYDIGAIQRDATWPISYIDWDAASEELKHDYTKCKIAGTTFYYREA